MGLQSYENLSERFIINRPDFKNQFCEIYKVRLQRMTELLKPRIVQKWENKYPIATSSTLTEEKPDKYVIVGTLFKNQKLKPSILKQITNFHNLDYQPISQEKLLSDTDSIFLEDSDQKYMLVGDIDLGVLITGITCGVLAKDGGNGKLTVIDICYVECPSQVPRSVPENDYFVLFVSGIDFLNSSKTALPFQGFIEWLKGHENQQHFGHLVIAGNSVSTHDTKENKVTLWSRDKFKEESLMAVQTFDQLLSQLLDVIDVSLMPGEFDPSDVILPQQPLHKCMFPKSYKTNRLHLVTNPYSFSIFGTIFLGTSGQNVHDIRKYCKYTEPIEILEKNLEWAHLAPNCPDTLGAFPLNESDPFIIDKCPHVLFTANEKNFQTKTFKGNEGQTVQLLSIPSFSDTLSVVQINLRTLESVLKTFESSDLNGICDDDDF